jgi:hypothetical protein
VYALCGDEYRVIGTYTGNKNKITMTHLKCGCNFDVTPNNFLSKYSRCPICCNRKIVAGINDMNTTNKAMAEYVLNENDKYRLSENSSIKIDWICPKCGSVIKNKTPYYINANGFICHKCSDGISYPNKFFNEFFGQLESNNLIKNYISEYSPDWISPKRFDNYFEINDNKFIVEVDGGIGHGKYVFKNSNKTVDGTLMTDNYKTQKAIEHDIKVIRINADKSDMEFIKSEIDSSILSNLFDLKTIDWERCNFSGLSSKKVMAIELYNNGCKSTGMIANKLGLNINTITAYLKDAANNSLCDYSKENSLKNRSVAYLNTTKVICINTSEIFNSISIAAKKYNIKSCSNIYACCGGLYKSAGRDGNGNKLQWMYYNEYLKLNAV